MTRGTELAYGGARLVLSCCTAVLSVCTAEQRGGTAGTADGRDAPDDASRRKEGGGYNRYRPHAKLQRPDARPLPRRRTDPSWLVPKCSTTGAATGCAVQRGRAMLLRARHAHPLHILVLL
eukprot:1198373-Rhodomonas_salina.1